jgi:transposase
LVGDRRLCQRAANEEPTDAPLRPARRQWERIEDLLPGRQGHVGVTAKDNRLFVEAVLYRYRAGIPWRDPGSGLGQALPERFGAWKKVHTRFGRWAKGGVWVRIFKHLAGEADNEHAMIDSTIVRAHQHSAGAAKKVGVIPAHRSSDLSGSVGRP